MSWCQRIVVNDCINYFKELGATRKTPISAISHSQSFLRVEWRIRTYFTCVIQFQLNEQFNVLHKI